MKDKHKMFEFSKESLKKEFKLEKEKYKSLERDISRFTVILVLFAMVLLWLYASNNGLLEQSIGYSYNESYTQEENIEIEEM